LITFCENQKVPMASCLVNLALTSVHGDVRTYFPLSSDMPQIVAHLLLLRPIINLLKLFCIL